MGQSVALLVDDALPLEPMRQWVPSVPSSLRFPFARQPVVMGKAQALGSDLAFSPFVMTAHGRLHKRGLARR